MFTRTVVHSEEKAWDAGLFPKARDPEKRFADLMAVGAVRREPFSEQISLLTGKTGIPHRRRGRHPAMLLRNRLVWSREFPSQEQENPEYE